MKQIIRTTILAVALLSPSLADTSTTKETASPESAAFAAQLKQLAEKVHVIEKQLQSSASMSGMDGDSSGDMDMKGMGKMKDMSGKPKMAAMGKMAKMGKGDESGGMDMGGKSDPSSGMNMNDPKSPKMGMGMGKDMMGMMGDMGMKKGMGGMDADTMAMPSALPGFPGASHLYHIGATGFFLNHGEHIELTSEQQVTLNKLKETSLLAKATSERKAAEAEQQLWQLTSAGEPDSKTIEEKIREIEKINGDQRIDFIRAVGEAAKVLTHEQHQALTGIHSPTNPATDPDEVDHSKH